MLVQSCKRRGECVVLDPKYHIRIKLSGHSEHCRCLATYSVKFSSYDMLSLETKILIREVYDEDYALFGSLCTENNGLVSFYVER